MVLINFFQFYSPQPENLVTPKHREPTGGYMEREREEERVGGKQTTFKLSGTTNLIHSHTVLIILSN